MTRRRTTLRDQRARAAALALLREVAGSADEVIARLVRESLADVEKRLDTRNDTPLSAHRISARYGRQLMAATHDVPARDLSTQHARDGAETMQAEKVHADGTT